MDGANFKIDGFFSSMDDQCGPYHHGSHKDCLGCCEVRETGLDAAKSTATELVFNAALFGDSLARRLLSFTTVSTIVSHHQGRRR